MRLTRASSRALLQQQRGSPSDSPNITTIDKLPDVILLEIFDSYRRGFGCRHNYENAWNGKNGWFKLAHVCQNWRRVVLASPSRLHLLLIFTPRSPQRAAMLTRLPPLPVFVNYGAGAQNVREENRVLSALKYSNRVWGIDFRPSGTAPKMLLKVLNYPLPELESLELELSTNMQFHFPITFIQGSAQRLRRLKLWGPRLSSLSQLLSSTTGLIGLSLGTDTWSCPSPPVSLPTLLQGMLVLRRLELKMWYSRHLAIDGPTLSTKTEDMVRLSHLTYFQFSGHTADLEGLLARLATPSLQDFRVDFYDYYYPSFSMPHLSRFIHDMDRPVFAAKFEFGRLALHTSMSSLLDLPFKITLPGTIPLAQISRMLSAALATVQDLLITISSWTFCRHPTEYREFLEQLRNAKILRVPPGLILDTMESLQFNDGEPALDVLPALEEIELHAAGDELISEDQRAGTLDGFEPFVAARQRAGRPVKVFWNTDQVLPKYFCDIND